MSQGRYVWIAGKKVYLNPELQKEWDKLINKERYRARQEKICGQADYRRCNGDCFVCPWRKEGIVVSYETEHFAEGFGNDNAARGYGVVNCESTLEEKYIAEERYNTLCARICRYADSAYPDGAKIIACYLNGETLESTAKELPSCMEQLQRKEPIRRNVRTDRAASSAIRSRFGKHPLRWSRILQRNCIKRRYRQKLGVPAKKALGTLSIFFPHMAWRWRKK